MVLLKMGATARVQFILTITLHFICLLKGTEETSQSVSVLHMIILYFPLDFSFKRTGRE